MFEPLNPLVNQHVPIRSLIPYESGHFRPMPNFQAPKDCLAVAVGYIR